MTVSLYFNMFQKGNRVSFGEKKNEKKASVITVMIRNLPHVAYSKD